MKRYIYNHEKPELILALLALIVWSVLVLYSPLGPFSSSDSEESSASDPTDSVVAYNSDNLRRVPDGCIDPEDGLEGGMTRDGAQNVTETVHGHGPREGSFQQKENLGGNGKTTSAFEGISRTGELLTLTDLRYAGHGGVRLSSQVLIPGVTPEEMDSEGVGDFQARGNGAGRLELGPEDGSWPPRLDGPSKRPKLAFIIDDWGYQWEAADGFLKLDVPMTYAVLPFEVNTAKHAQMAAEAGFEVILHLPMEPSGDANPGRGAILTSLSSEEIRSLVQQALAAVPQAKGVNNHMGSRATEDFRVMRDVMEVLYSRGLFFVDSHTSPRTVAPAVARELRIPFAQNQVFIDNRADVEYVKQRIWLAAEMAEAGGSAVAIGHVKSATLAALQEAIPELRRRGIELVTVSELLTTPEGAVTVSAFGGGQELPPARVNTQDRFETMEPQVHPQYLAGCGNDTPPNDSSKQDP